MELAQLFEMDRRQWLARAFLIVGVSATGSASLSSLVKSEGGLDKAQFALLVAVTDTILPKSDTPGAVEVGVPALIDAMVTNWASEHTRRAILEALDRIDAATRSQKNADFAALSPADRKSVLQMHEAMALDKIPRPPGAPERAIFVEIPYVADDGYLKLKDLVISLYYSSETAMTQELIYEHVPGEWQPSIKVTEATRPWASIGPF